MAEKKAAKKDEHAGEKKDEAKKGGFLTKLPVLLGGVMVIEAIVLLAGLKLLGFGAPKEAVAAELAEHDAAETHAAAGDEGHGEAAKDDGHGEAAKADAGGEAGKEGEKAHKKYEKKKSYELQLVEFRAPNKMSGRTFLYDISIFALVKGEHADKVQRTLKDREALIKDRVRTIIAQSDPEKLGGGSEPGLETLRRQVKYQLDELVGEGLIEEVLVPKCIPFRTDF